MMRSGKDLHRIVIDRVVFNDGPVGAGVRRLGGAAQRSGTNLTVIEFVPDDIIIGAAMKFQRPFAEIQSISKGPAIEIGEIVVGDELSNGADGADDVLAR